MADSIRIDKYIWAIRCFKTRSEATEACKGNKVQIGGQPVKPSREVKVGDIIQVRKGPVQYTYKVLQLAENRMGAQLVPDAPDTVLLETTVERRPLPDAFLSNDS